MVKKERHFLAIIVIFLIVFFTAGILVGRVTVSGEIDELSQLVNQNELDTESYVIEQSLVTSLIGKDCDSANIQVDFLFKELYKLGSFLEQSESKNLFVDNYLLLKKKYNLNQIRTYLLINEIKNECNYENPVILFFYGDDSESIEQGKILDEIVSDFNAKVFAIEYGYAEEIGFLEDFYEIDSVPSLIINYENILHDKQSYSQIKSEIQ